MPPIDRIYAGGAVQTVSSTTFTPTTPGAGQTFTVADDAGWPSSGNIPVKLNRGLSDEEHVLCTRVGLTFTVVQRGYDGTSAQAHTNPTVEIYFDARSANLLVDHTDGVEADPHSTKLLNNARHDIEARHTFGAAYGTPGTPTALTPDIAGAAGTGNNPAREDHAHNVPADVPVSVGTALAEGAGAAFARSNHVHDIGAAAIDDVAMFSSTIAPVVVQGSDPGAIGAGRLWFNSTTTVLALFVRNAANTAWLREGPGGIVGREVLTADSSGFSATGATDLNVTYTPDTTRAYEVTVLTIWTVTVATGRWIFNLTDDATNFARVGDTTSVGINHSDVLHSTALWLPSSGGSHSIELRVGEVGDGSTITLQATATEPRSIWIKDLGPR